MLRWIWITFCALIGCAIGAALLGLRFDSVVLAIIGGVIGLVLGSIFGRVVKLWELLDTWFG